MKYQRPTQRRNYGGVTKTHIMRTSSKTLCNTKATAHWVDVNESDIGGSICSRCKLAMNEIKRRRLEL